MKIFTLFTFVAALLFISVNKLPYKKFLKKTAFVYIPSGSFLLSNKSVSVHSFVMLDHEVTNFEYYEFIKSNYLSKGDSIGASLALPDTAAWSDTNIFNGFNDPMVKWYHVHPAYYNYPVVNVSKENAKKYCIWLTEKMRKAYPDNTFNDFRLPTKVEWIYAAKGGLKESPYPWGGAYIRNSKGFYLANFNTVGENNITAGEDGKPNVVSNRKVQISNNISYGPVQSKSFIPNTYKLYNMSGNVAELVADEDKAMGGHWMSYGNDIQVTSEIEFSKANPMVGFRPIMSYSTK